MTVSEETGAGAGGAGRGAIWAAVDSWSTQLLQLAAFIVIGNLVGPAVYGVMAAGMVYAFIVMSMLRDSFGEAIVQRRALVSADVDVAFWLLLGLGVAAAVVSIPAAPVLAAFFRMPDLVMVIWALGASFPAAAIANLLASLLRRRMAFRTLALKSLAVWTASAGIAIALALQGAGLWALIVYQTVPAFLELTILWAVLAYRPRFVFDRDAARAIVGYGAATAGGNLLNTLAYQADRIVVGALLGAEALGIFGLARRMVEVFHNAIIGVLNMVALPAFARLQAQPRRLRAAIARTTMYACLIAFPVTVGLALVAGPLVHALFRPVWHDAAPVLAILAAFGVVIPARVVVSAALRAVGRPDLALRLAAVAFVLRAGASLAAIAAGWGLSGVALLGSAAQAVMLPVRARTLMAAAGMTIWRYFGAMTIPAAATVVMAAVVFVVRVLLEPQTGPALLVAAMVMAGVAVYAGACATLAPHLPARLLRHVRR